MIQRQIWKSSESVFGKSLIPLPLNCTRVALTCTPPKFAGLLLRNRKYREKEEKVLSRMLFLFRCRFHPKSAGNPLGLPRMTATGQNGPLSYGNVPKVKVEINRDQPKSLASSWSSARSKWQVGTSRVHRPELNRFFHKVRSLIAWSFKLWPTWPQY